MLRNVTVTCGLLLVPMLIMKSFPSGTATAWSEIDPAMAISAVLMSFATALATRR